MSYDAFEVNVNGIIVLFDYEYLSLGYLTYVHYEASFDAFYLSIYLSIYLSKA